MERFSQDMPLLEGDDFFKNLDMMEQDFLIEGDIQVSHCQVKYCPSDKCEQNLCFLYEIFWTNKVI
ncbi:hypothetical protein DPMN_065250 [Dreissena polymorpha]|uniref:Uncharacterized protein n=1 Tax=Dreissena polymorpha TaxID=45954 RepID=A0A9D4CFE0_DREPO|nr:hypothetical protein DPMN_065250 [Dreissena polymorpha]